MFRDISFRFIGSVRYEGSLLEKVNISASECLTLLLQVSGLYSEDVSQIDVWPYRSNMPFPYKKSKSDP